MDDLLSVEDAPSDGVDVIVSNILELLSLHVDSLPREVFKLSEVLRKLLDQALVNEELEVSLLVNVPFLWAPPESRVGGLGAVDLWLRVDGQELCGVELQEGL